jgi:glycosyltransferase involved in cell wall biosynthesis
VWFPYQAFDPDEGGDIFVAWRDSTFVPRGGRWTQVYHWVHDRQDWSYPQDVAERVDRILVLSKDHAANDGFSHIDRAKIYRTSNAIEEEFLRPPGDNVPHRAIYASCPARGLMTVLELWPEIRRRVPDAVLDVFYGFTPAYDDMAESFPGLKFIKAACLQLLDQPAVRFHGMVGHQELAEAFAASGVWLYPTDCRETSCITAMKALAMGCLPVTSGLAVLGETLGGRDLGPVHPTRPISRSRWRRWQFLRATVRAMREGGSDAARHLRLEWAAWARRQYSWPVVALDWCQLFDQVAAVKRRS